MKTSPKRTRAAALALIFMDNDNDKNEGPIAPGTRATTLQHEDRDQITLIPFCYTFPNGCRAVAS